MDETTEAEFQRKWIDLADEINIPNKQAEMVTALFRMKFPRTTIPDNWRQWLRPGVPNARFDYVAADMLAAMCKWNTAWKDRDGKLRTRKISTNDGMKLTLTYFVEALGHSLYQVREGLHHLGQYELVTYEPDRYEQKPCYLIKLKLKNLMRITVTQPPKS